MDKFKTKKIASSCLLLSLFLCTFITSCDDKSLNHITANNVGNDYGKPPSEIGDVNDLTDANNQYKSTESINSNHSNSDIAPP